MGSSESGRSGRRGGGEGPPDTAYPPVRYDASNPLPRQRIDCRSLNNVVILFYNGLDVPTRQILYSKGAILTKTTADAKVAIQEMAEYSQKWHNRTSSKTRSTKTSDGLAAIEAQLNNLGRKLRKNNENSSYPNRRQTIEESLTKFMAESTKIHKENSNKIKEIQASTDAAIKNQGASIKTLEIQIGQMHKVLQEKGFRSLPSSTEPNPKDQVNLILTTQSDSTGIHFIILDIREDNDVPLILGRPFLSTAHAKIEVFKRKINLRVGEEKLVFKSIKLANSIIRRVYMLKEGTNLDSKTELIGEAVNESFGPRYGNYIKLNDLDEPLKPRMNQDNNFEQTLDENIIVNEPTFKSCYKMKFSCMIGYKHVIADFLPSLSINMMTTRLYNSIIQDKGDHEGKKLTGTLIDIPIFVGNFSIILGFSIIIDMDVTSGVVLGMPLCKKFVTCQNIMEKFTRRDECEQIKDKG
nr:hypothetical protein [Tanacetum cinerariifolium]